MSDGSPCPELDPLVCVGGEPVALDHLLLDRSWGRQHVVIAGPAGAEVIVLLHGWPQHWFAWRHVIADLATTHRVVAIDLRGLGWSVPGLTGVDTIGELADDVIAVLDDLGVASAVLAGHDWGGWIGFRAVHDHPARFGAYSSLSIAPPWLDPRRMLDRLAHWAYTVPMAVAGPYIARRPAWVRALLSHSTFDVSATWRSPAGRAAARSYTSRIGRPDAAVMTTRLYGSLFRGELRSAWAKRTHRFPVPAAVLLGDHEAISTPPMFWDRTFPGELRVVTVARANHWLAEEQPRAVVDHLRRQLASVSAAQLHLEPAGERPGLDS